MRDLDRVAEHRVFIEIPNPLSYHFKEPKINIFICMDVLDSTLKDTSRKWLKDADSPRRFMSAPRLPAPSISGVESQKRNTLKNKVIPYHRLFSETIKNSGEDTNVYRLASDIYSKSPERPRTTLSLKKIKKASPELPEQITQKQVLTLSMLRQSQKEQSVSKSQLITNLKDKTYRVPALNEQILSLTHDKRHVEHYVESLKRKIIQQTKLKMKLNLTCKKHMNSIQKHNHLLYKNDIEINQTQMLLDEALQHCKGLQFDLDRLDERNQSTLECIEQDRSLITELKQYISQCKHGIIKQDKQLNEVKEKLTASLKVMESKEKQKKYYESEKAQILLYIKDMTDIHRVDT